MAFAALEQYQEAEKCLKSSVEALEGSGFRPELARCYQEYARFLEKMGRTEEAAAMRQKAGMAG
jgi:tetratricopeptide (TPR) repeat protein